MRTLYLAVLKAASISKQGHGWRREQERGRQMKEREMVSSQNLSSIFVKPSHSSIFKKASSLPLISPIKKKKNLSVAETGASVFVCETDEQQRPVHSKTIKNN